MCSKDIVKNLCQESDMNNSLNRLIGEGWKGYYCNLRFINRSLSHFTCFNPKKCLRAIPVYSHLTFNFKGSPEEKEYSTFALALWRGPTGLIRISFVYKNHPFKRWNHVQCMAVWWLPGWQRRQGRLNSGIAGYQHGLRWCKLKRMLRDSISPVEEIRNSLHCQGLR